MLYNKQIYSSRIYSTRVQNTIQGLKSFICCVYIGIDTILIHIGYMVENKSLTFIYFPSLCVRAVKAMTRLLVCPG